MNGDNGRSGDRPEFAAGDAVDILWNDYCKQHLQPSRLFRLAVGLSIPDKEEQNHIEWCDRCRLAFERYRSAEVGCCGTAELRPGTPERVNRTSTAAKNGHQWTLPLVDMVAAARGTAVPDLLRQYIRVVGPVLFPDGEVAFETWQLGRIEQVAKAYPEVAEQISAMIVDRTYEVLQPRLTRQRVVLVCFGRTLHRMGTRLAARLVEQGYGHVHVILAHDFYSPTLVCGPGELRDADVSVMVDVMHTGGLLERLFSACRENLPARIRGVTLIDQSDGAVMTEDVVSLWMDGPELRIPLQRFRRTATAQQRRELTRFEPNDEYAMGLEVALPAVRTPVESADVFDADEVFIDLVHRAGALRSDYRIGQKQYPYVINVLDLLREPMCRERVLAKAFDVLSDLADSSPCLVYHAARTARAGRVAKALGERLSWPAFALDADDRSERYSGQFLQKTAGHRTVVLVDAAVRTGDSLTAMMQVIDDLSFRKGRRIVAFCILDALTQRSRTEFAESLNAEIRTLYRVPLAPPTERVRNWMNSRKAAIRDALLQSGILRSLEPVLQSYVDRKGRRGERTAPATPDETLAAVRNAARNAGEPVRATESISEACRLGKVGMIRHLPLDQVVHDRAVQSLLLGVMYNSMSPSFKESAVFALGAAGNYEWMTYDWLQCNRPFLSSPTQAWKSVLMVECQMKIEEQTSELCRFRDALERFSTSLPKPKPIRVSPMAAQRRFEFGLKMDSSPTTTERLEINECERLTERVRLLQQACE